MTTRAFPNLLQESGEALYGENWKAAMAAELLTDRKAIWRWATGAFVPSERGWIIQRLIRRLEIRSEECETLIRKLRALE